MVSNTNEKLYEMIEEVRKFINISRKHFELRQNGPLFSQLVSSLDVLEDTQYAIDAYALKEYSETLRGRYIAVYGLFQALFVQQDALQHLCESLKANFRRDKFPRLKEIRDIRNNAVGHPTKGDYGKSFHHISQRTMSHAGFDMLSFYSDGSNKFRKIDILGLIADQHELICEILENVILILRTEENAHRQTFRQEKLMIMFPNTIDYHCSKIIEGVNHEESSMHIGDIGLEAVKEAFHDFREAVSHRDKDFYESLEDEYILINHAIGFLEDFFDSQKKQKIPSNAQNTAKIFSLFLRNQIDQFRKYGKEIDDDYDQNL